MSEILHVATFDTICSSKFVTNCVNCRLPTPNKMPPINDNDNSSAN